MRAANAETYASETELPVLSWSLLRMSISMPGFISGKLGMELISKVSSRSCGCLARLPREIDAVLLERDASELAKRAVLATLDGGRTVDIVCEDRAAGVECNGKGS